MAYICETKEATAVNRLMEWDSIGLRLDCDIGNGKMECGNDPPMLDILPMSPSNEFISVKNQKLDNVPIMVQDAPVPNLQQFSMVQAAPEREQCSASSMVPLSVPQHKLSKTFKEDGPALPLPRPGEHVADLLGCKLRPGNDGKKAQWVSQPHTGFRLHVTQPSNRFQKGFVRYTTVNALEEMVAELPTLSSHVQQGCIIEEDYAPKGNCYTQDEDFMVYESIGKGSYGEVERCINLTSQKGFVKKRVQRSNFRQSEVTIPINLKHNNVTKVFGLLCDGNDGEDTVHILLEDAGTALNHYLVTRDLSPSNIWELSKQGLAGLSHLHRYDMIHLDIKPENLCIQKVDSGLRLRITDFGSAKLPQEQLQFVGMTPEYMAPEMCRLFLQAKYKESGLDFGITEEDIGGKVDVFGFSLVMMYMYKRYHLLVKYVMRGETSYGKIDNNTRKLLQENLMVQLAGNTSLVADLICDECDLDMRELLTKMTHFDPVNRISAKDGVQLIEVRERRMQNAALVMMKQRQQAMKEQQLCLKPSQVQTQLTYGDNPHIPAFSTDMVDFDRGPIKYSTINRLREKLHHQGKKPYPGKRPSIQSKTMLPVDELGMLSRSVASKKMTLPPTPQTPVSEMWGLSLKDGNTQVTEMNTPVAQPADECVYTQMSGPVQPVDDTGYVDIATAVRPTAPDVVISNNIPNPALNLPGKIPEPALHPPTRVITNPEPSPAPIPCTDTAPLSQLKWNAYMVNGQMIFINAAQHRQDPAQILALPAVPAQDSGFAAKGPEQEHMTEDVAGNIPNFGSMFL